MNKFVSLISIISLINLYPSALSKNVDIHKLCSWNTITFNDIILRDANDQCKILNSPNYIPENNIPTAFEIAEDGRVFVGIRRNKVGIPATLSYFNISDIKDGVCPPLNPYPSFKVNDFVIESCADPDLIYNVERFNIDSCTSDPKLWVVDLKGFGTAAGTEIPFIAKEPELLVISLKTNTVVRRISLPRECSSIGLTTVIINVDPCNCNKAYAYILDKINGHIIVYSWEEDRVWKFSSPLFGFDPKRSNFEVKTSKNSVVKYSVGDKIFDATRDLKNQRLIFHARASLDEFAIPFSVLNNSSSTDLSITHLGEKNKNGQTGTHQINAATQTVWGVQEQNYAIACWNTERELNADAVKLVASDHAKLKFLVDLQRTPLPGTNMSSIFVLSNNERSISVDGFHPDVENFGIYFIYEYMAFHAFPECLPPKKPHPHPHTYPHPHPKPHPYPHHYDQYYQHDPHQYHDYPYYAQHVPSQW